MDRERRESQERTVKAKPERPEPDLMPEWESNPPTLSRRDLKELCNAVQI